MCGNLARQKNYLFWIRLNNFSLWWLPIYIWKKLKHFRVTEFCIIVRCITRQKTTLNIPFELQLDCNHNSQTQIHLQSLRLASINVEENHFQKGWLMTQIWWTKEDIPILEWSWLKNKFVFIIHKEEILENFEFIIKKNSWKFVIKFGTTVFGLTCLDRGIP